VNNKLKNNFYSVIDLKFPGDANDRKAFKEKEQVMRYLGTKFQGIDPRSPFATRTIQFGHSGPPPQRTLFTVGPVQPVVKFDL